MGLVFDRNIARLYESWYRSQQGRAIDRSIEQLVLTLLKPKPMERVLDVGCGTGNNLLALSKLGLDVSGLDASEYMIERARERLGNRCSLKRGMAEDLPFDDNEFDLVVLINTLEFLDNPLKALREAGRVANRKIFIGVLNSLSWNGLLKKIQGYLGDPLFSQVRFFNLWQLRHLLNVAYGHVPMSWGCITLRPSFIQDSDQIEDASIYKNRSPFGSFLGISATMRYRVKTNGLPLKAQLKKSRQSLIRARASGG